MRVAALFCVALAIAGCDRQPSPEESAAAAERDVAMVEQANDAAPPINPVTPEPITYHDIEQHQMAGQACNYAPGTSLGTRAIAREADAFVKVDGEVRRLAADAGSRALPGKSWSAYDGREYALRLAISGQGKPATTDSKTIDYEGTLTLRDQWGREIYRGTGLVQCGA